MAGNEINSDAAIRKLKTPAAGRVDYKDRGTPGLYLRVNTAGVKTWRLVGRLKGHSKQQVYTLGEFAPESEKTHVGLHDARLKAEQYKASLRGGVDPRDIERQKRKEAELKQRRELERQQNTFANIRKRFLAQYVDKNLKPNTQRHYRSLLASGDLKPWESLPIEEINKSEVISLIDRIEARGVFIQARRTLAYLKVFFNWCVDRGILPDDRPLPTTRVKPTLTREPKRKRYLSAEEIRLFWRAAQKLGYPFGTCFQLILATGQRREEAASIDQKTLDPSKGHWVQTENKANREHIVPLTTLSLDLIDSCPKLEGSSLLFTTTGTTPISGYSRAKKRLDQYITEFMEEDELTGVFDEPWQLHDLRRTITTNLREMGYSRDVCGRILNHAEKGVTAEHYDIYDMLPEKTEALNAWGDYLQRLITGNTENVVPIKQSGS